MARPELKQFGELEPEDFERHPVWIGCHTADYGKPWYESTDEETFRPWTGKLPADLSEGMLLVRATFVLPDGTRYPGFVTPSDKADDLGIQQPQIFVDEQRFGFWGGMSGFPGDTQQALYAALDRDPKEIFPLRFSGSPELATGMMTGQVKGFYTRTGEEVRVAFSERKRQIPTFGAKWFRMQARGGSGYPQPEKAQKYKELNYRDICLRCGIHAGLRAPFRFNKSHRRPLSGFWQPGWVYDAFFVSPEMATAIGKSGITGVSFGPVLDHRAGVELTDRVQLLMVKTFSCMEATHLPTVTCRPDNEEVTAMRKRWPARPKSTEEKTAGKPSWWGGTESSYATWKKKVDREHAWIAALPYCGRVRYHPPTSVAIISGSLDGAPDLCQSAEWVGSGALAYRLTFASERFVALVRERKWKGLMFSEVPQQGFSEREMKS